MGNNVSPEEKLLKLIKGQKYKDAAPKVAQNIQPSTPELKPLSKAAFPEQLRRVPAFFTLNRLILISFVFSGIYLAVSLAGAFSGYKKIELTQGSQSTKGRIEISQALGAGPKEDKKPFEFYTQVTGGRNIFAAEAESQDKTQKTESAINNDALKDLNIVGIIADRNPQVIIEDRKTQKTHYVGKGQSIGDFTVEEIREGKVILNNKGKRFELNI